MIRREFIQVLKMNCEVLKIEVFSNDNFAARRFNVMRILFNNLHPSIYINGIENP